MAFTLDHTIVPTRDKETSAQWLARIFGLQRKESTAIYARLPVSDSLTLLFYDSQEPIVGHH